MGTTIEVTKGNVGEEMRPQIGVGIFSYHLLDGIKDFSLSINIHTEGRITIKK